MNALADDGNLQFHSMCFRCGWATKNLHSAFDYIFNSGPKDQLCGKVLSNWHETGHKGHIKGGIPPNASDIKTYQEQLYTFINNLFAKQIYLVNKKIKYLLLGSILLWEDDFVSAIVNGPSSLTYDNEKKHPFLTELQKVKQESGK